MKVDIARGWWSFGETAFELPSEEVYFTPPYSVITFVRHTALVDSNFPEMALQFPGAKLLQADIACSWERSDAPRNAKLFSSELGWMVQGTPELFLGIKCFSSWK
jgi:hypothetical protein